MRAEEHKEGTRNTQPVLTHTQQYPRFSSSSQPELFFFFREKEIMQEIAQHSSRKEDSTYLKAIPLNQKLCAYLWLARAARTSELQMEIFRHRAAKLLQNSSSLISLWPRKATPSPLVTMSPEGKPQCTEPKWLMTFFETLISIARTYLVLLTNSELRLSRKEKLYEQFQSNKSTLKNWFSDTAKKFKWDRRQRTCQALPVLPLQHKTMR